MATSAVIFSEQTTDPLIQDVVRTLQGRDSEPLLISTRHLHELELELNFDADSGALVAAIDGLNIATADTRVWWRRGSRPKAEDLASESDAGVAAYRSAQYAQTLNSLISASLSAGARWMNDPFVERKFDQNKLLQHQIAHQVGLTTPPTICTNDPKAASAFAARFRTLAVKAAAGFALTTSNADKSDIRPLMTYTQRLSADDLVAMLSHVSAAPMILQPYVEKEFELRVTIVGDKIFAAKIESQKSEHTRVDWRNYDMPNTPYSSFELDRDTRQLLLDFMRACGLVFAAVDLIVTPEGQIVFIEANPAGQYGWIEALTDLPITESIAAWLGEETP